MLNPGNWPGVLSLVDELIGAGEDCGDVGSGDDDEGDGGCCEVGSGEGEDGSGDGAFDAGGGKPACQGVLQVL